MMTPESWQPLVYSLGWTILHSFWQFCLLAALLGFYLQWTSGQSARQRYQVAFAGLLGGAIAATVTFCWYYTSTSLAAGISMHADAGIVQQISVSTSASGTVSTTNLLYWLDEHVNWISFLWLIGFLVLAIRYLLAFVWMQRLRSKQLSAIPLEWQERFSEILLASGIRKMVAIKSSALVSGPLTLGFYKPLVLLPLGFFTQLAPAQVEAIFLHEIAHIRRYDYLCNLLQTALQVIFFYHPAVWFISRVIDAEREHACDDYALARTGDPEAYARTLGFLQLHFSTSKNQMAMHFMQNQSSVLARLQRLLQPASENNRLGAKLLSPLILLLIAATLGLFQVWGGAQNTLSPAVVIPGVVEGVASTLPGPAVVGSVEASSSVAVSPSPEVITITGDLQHLDGVVVEDMSSTVSPLPEPMVSAVTLGADSIPVELEKELLELQKMREELVREREQLRVEREALAREREEQLQQNQNRVHPMAQQLARQEREEAQQARGMAQPLARKERQEAQQARGMARQEGNENARDIQRSLEERSRELARVREDREREQMAQERKLMRDARMLNTDAFKEKLQNELIKDGLLKDQNERFTLEIINGKGRLDGKPLSKEKTAKYDAIMDEYGMARGQKRTITITENSFSKNSTSNDEQ